MAGALDPADVSAALARLTAGRTLDDPAIRDDALEALVEATGADDGRVYALNLSNGRYESDGALTTSSSASWDARRLRSKGGWGPLEQAVYSRKPQLLDYPTTFRVGEAEHSYPARLVLPVLRRESVVAVVDLHGLDAGAFAPWEDADLLEAQTSALLQQLANTYEARSVHRILEQTATFHVELAADQETALDRLVKFVGTSSAMQYAILRRLDDDGALEVVKAHGFEPGAETRLNFSNLQQDYVPFHEVVTTKAHWVAANLDDPIYDALRAAPDLHDVRSFVACPVLVGQSLWGVLSFASGVEYSFSELEVYSLRVLANLTGVALETRESSFGVAETGFDDGQLMQAVLANEVVVATRHEMDDHLEIIGASRSTLLDVLRPMVDDPKRGLRLTRADLQSLLKVAQVVDSAHGELNKVLDTLRISQKDLIEEHNPVNVHDAWERAKGPFSYRINRSRVGRVECEPVSVLIDGSEDWLRIVFMHLILNSLDAFDRGHAKHKREIVLRLESRSQNVAHFRYYDTAGGIDAFALRKRGDGNVATDLNVSDAIFTRFVSSKPRGTGLGLASCRAAMSVMGGSISLKDWRSGGVTFDLVLPLWRE